MNVCVTGWYGSETLGDRGILLGIIEILSHIDRELKVELGSLYPFFTERTIFLDQDAYKEACPDIEFHIFNERKENELYDSISKSEVVIMGGGPIMDIEDTKIIRKAFRFAKANNKKTILFGVGIGPLREKRYIRVVRDIIKDTDLCIFRDEVAEDYCESVFNRSEGTCVLPDPAFVAAVCFKENNRPIEKKEYIAVNLREFPGIYGEISFSLNDEIKKLFTVLDREYSDIKLIPMHDFFHGGDDRTYFANLLYDSNYENIKAFTEPISINKLFSLYAEAQACIAMRYHAAAFQSILNGNNYILDYTEPNNGKITGLLSGLDTDFYSDRYVCLQTTHEIDGNGIISKLREGNAYDYKEDYETVVKNYLEILKKVM